MKAFKNRLEEMAEATVNALDYSDSKVEYSILMYTQHQARFERIRGFQ